MNTTVISRRHLLMALGAAGLSGTALAQGYPNRAVKLVCPFAPGGSADLTARMFAARLSSVSGANIFVEAITGAGGTIGSDRVAKAAPDGYTLLLSNVASQGAAPSLYPKLNYDALADFEHIALFGSFPNVLVIPASNPAQSFAEFLAQAKKKTGTLNFGSAGNGTTTHLTSELFNARTGVRAEHIAYKGSGPALMALLGGEISFMFENLTGALPHIRGGKLRALAMTGSTRSALLPNVPTMQEVGMNDFVIGSWYGLSAPAKTPKAIVDYFAKATAQALQDPEMKKQIADAGIEASAIAPEQYRDFVAAEIKRWSAIIKASGATIG